MVDPLSSVTSRIAILGDSRVFDTYYLNDSYAAGYGYQASFAHLLRARLWQQGVGQDVIHIPDHFRSGTIENNILRLALTDPNAVVLCDGIWETLVSKEMYLDYATRRITEHGSRSGRPLSLEYSTAELARLFVAGELSISPQGYAQRIRKIASFFYRRRRQTWWMNLVIPPADYLRHVHYAGHYRCIPEWGDCLSAVNTAVAEALAPLGAGILDIHQWAQEVGGPSVALLDQWHYSESFHQTITDRLAALFSAQAEALRLPADHLSHRFMVPGAPYGDRPLAVWGVGDAAGAWLEAHPTANVVAILTEAPTQSHFYSIPVHALKDASSLPCDLLVMPGEDAAVFACEVAVMSALPVSWVVVRPEEERVENPRRATATAGRGAP